MKTCVQVPFRYPFEEFADQVRAMGTVRTWEYTSRFGYLGKAQNSRAHSARIIEYFSDCYEDSREALAKADLFLSIHDYIGRHASFFARKDVLENGEGGGFGVDPALLRAVHYAFTAGAGRGASPRKVLALARALEAVSG